MAIGTKHCKKCDRTKPVSAFHSRPNRPCGTAYKCIECARADNRRHSRNRDPDERRAYLRQWYAENLARNPDARRAQWLRRYGITPAEYDAILERQGGKCALCCRGAGVRALHVDHCHGTGRVRGLLCGPCNRAVGVLGDSAENLSRAVEYLKE